MEIRRSSRLKMLPVVVGGCAVGSFLLIPPPFIIFSLYWAITSVVQVRQRFRIEDQRIVMYGYIGGPISISKEDVGSCTYTRFKAGTRGSFDMSFMAIRGATGTIRVWRYGWGRQREKLFRELGVWLADTNAVIDATSRAMLSLADGGSVRS